MIESRSLNNNNNNRRLVKDYDFIMWDIKNLVNFERKKKKKEEENRDNARLKEKNKKYMRVAFTDWKTFFVLKITSLKFH